MKTTTLILNFILFTFLSLNAQTNIFSEIIFHNSDNVICTSIDKGFHNDFVIAGYSNIIRIDSVGAIIYSKRIEELSFKTVNQSKDSSFIFSGEFHNNSTSNNDLFFLKTDTNLNVVFLKTIDFGTSISVLSADITADSGIVVCGYISNSSNPYSKILVCRLDKYGDLIWSKSILAGNSENIAIDIKYANDSSILVTGEIFSNGASFPESFILKMNGEGVILWLNKPETLPVNHLSIGYGITSVNSNIYCNFGNYILKLDQNGLPLWSYQYSMYSQNSWGWFNMSFHPVKFHLTTDSTLMFISKGVSEIDSLGNVISGWDLYLESTTDVLETNDNGKLFIGNGPIQGVKEKAIMYQHHIGIIKSDSLQNTVNCAYTYNDTSKVITNIILNSLSYQEETPITETNINPQYTINDYTLYTSPGCVDFIGQIQEESKTDVISIYPNPSKEIITIEVNEESGNIYRIEILDILGRNKLIASDIDSKSTSINIKNLCNGVYFVKLSLKNGNTITKKIVKN